MKVGLAKKVGPSLWVINEDKNFILECEGGIVTKGR